MNELPELKLAYAVKDLLENIFMMFNITENTNIDCKFEQLSKPDSNNKLPLDREINVHVINPNLSLDFYIKCIDNENSEYYLTHNSEKYFIVKGKEINMVNVADALDLAQIPFGL